MIDKERLVLWCGLQGKLAADARRDWYSSLGRSPHKQMRGVTLAIKLDKHRNSFQLAHRAPPLSVTDSSICPFRKDDCKPARPFLHLDEKRSGATKSSRSRCVMHHQIARLISEQ